MVPNWSPKWSSKWSPKWSPKWSSKWSQKWSQNGPKMVCYFCKWGGGFFGKHLCNASAIVGIHIRAPDFLKTRPATIAWIECLVDSGCRNPRSPVEWLLVVVGAELLSMCNWLFLHIGVLFVVGVFSTGSVSGALVFGNSRVAGPIQKCGFVCRNVWEDDA